jgi:hypothetical protein
MIMKRTLIIFVAVVVGIVVGYTVMSRTDTVDTKQKVEIMPPGGMPHGGAEKPVTTGIGPGETKR